jgi:hypothetical protein
MDERLIAMVLDDSFDVSQLPCQLLAQYFYTFMALRRRFRG